MKGQMRRVHNLLKSLVGAPGRCWRVCGASTVLVLSFRFANLPGRGFVDSDPDRSIQLLDEDWTTVTTVGEIEFSGLAAS